MSLRLLDRRAGTEVRSAPEPGEIDPRIQARRDGVSRERLRRRRRRGLIVVAVAAVVAVVYGVVHSPVLDVDRIDVAATPHVSTEDVIEITDLRPGVALVDVDPGAVRTQLSSLPWVEEARVDVDWPAGVVRIEITERVPVAAVAGPDAEWITVDASGRAVSARPSGAPGLIAVENVAPVVPGSMFGPGIEAPLEVIAGLSPGLRSRVFAVIADTDGTIQLRVLPSGIVDLCRPDGLVEKLAAATTWFAAVDDADLATLSVCVPDSPTATRAPPS